jgi:hypothetical protein
MCLRRLSNPGRAEKNLVEQAPMPAAQCSEGMLVSRTLFKSEPLRSRVFR